MAVYVRDQHARDSQLSLSGTAAHGIFVHLYLNGIYWGVYNAVERPERRFLASYYGGDPADWFAINHSGVVGSRTTRAGISPCTVMRVSMTSRSPQNTGR